MIVKKFKLLKLKKKFKNTEKLRLSCKFLEKYIFRFLNKKIYFSKRKKLNIFHKYISAKYSKSSINTRCIFTNRGIIASKVYRSSRFTLRNLIQFGLIAGYKKSIW